MGRVSNFQGGTKQLTASTLQTVVFTPQDLETAGLVMLHFGFMGPTTVGTFNTVQRIRVRAGPDLLIDCTAAQLQALQQAYSKRTVGDLTANAFFTVPLLMLDAPTEDDQDMCQFPPGREIQVEIDVNAGAGAGQSILAAWTLSDRPAVYYPRYYSNVLNFSASANNQRYPIVEAGIVRGITLPSANIARAKLAISGKIAFELPSTTYGGATTAADLLSAKDYFTDGITVTAQKFHKVSLNMAAAQGNSYLLMDTGASFAATDTMAMHSVVPLTAAA